MHCGSYILKAKLLVYSALLCAEIRLYVHKSLESLSDVFVAFIRGVHPVYIMLEPNIV